MKFRIFFSSFFVVCSVSLMYSQANTKLPEVPVTESKFLIPTKPSPTSKHLPMLQKQLKIPVGSLPNPIGVSLIYNYVEETYRIKSFKGEFGDKLSGLSSILGTGQREWLLSAGTVHTKTHAVGAKVDIFLLPFLQLFVLGAYLKVDQTTDVGDATVPFVKPINIPTIPGIIQGGTWNSMTIPVGKLSNSLDGFVTLAGLNLLLGYKGFFFSFMMSGGYVRLDDRQNDIIGFVEKPIMYMAPRIGYSYNGVFTAHAGVQRVEMFGATKGNDLTKITGGLVQTYLVDLVKFPVNFVVGMQFMFMRELGLSIEYVGNPDGHGVNLETVFRF